MDDAKLRVQVAEIDWWHRIDLGRGIVTPGKDDSPAKLKTLGMLADLSGKTVLDIGAWDGFFSFEAERRGAKSVLATDSYIWDGNVGPYSKAGFDLAKKALKSKVKERNIPVLDLSRKAVGGFDVVLFLGVLYHMRHPLLSLERVADVTDDMLILETLTDLSNVKRPAAAFYPEGLEGDRTNWWGPNMPALTAMLKDVGFRRVQLVYSHPFWFRLGRGVKLMGKGMSLAKTIHQSRVVVHAWK